MTEEVQEENVETVESPAEAVEEIKEVETIDDALAAAMESNEEKPEEDRPEEAPEEKEEDKPEVAATEAPQHWAKDDKEAFSSITDPKAKELIMQMDARFQKAHQNRMNELNTKYEPVLKELEPFRQLMQRDGLDETATLQRMVKERSDFERLFAQDPKNLVSSLARKAGIEIYFDDGSAASEMAPTPENQEIATLRAELDSIKNGWQQQSKQAVIAEINEFADAVDEAGNKLRPHFDRLSNEIMNLISISKQNNQPITLEQAYQKAVRLDDELYNETVERQLSERLQSQEQNRTKQLEVARKGATRLSGRAPARKVSEVNSIDDAFNLALQSQTQTA